MRRTREAGGLGLNEAKALSPPSLRHSKVEMVGSLGDLQLSITTPRCRTSAFSSGSSPSFFEDSFLKLHTSLRFRLHRLPERAGNASATDWHLQTLSIYTSASKLKLIRIPDVLILQCFDKRQVKRNSGLPQSLVQGKKRKTSTPVLMRSRPVQMLASSRAHCH